MGSFQVGELTFTEYSYLVFPHIKEGDLRDFLNIALTKKLRSPMLLAEYICRELLMLGITHHGLGLAHRDVKPDNIVINNNYQLAYIDFQT